MQKKYVYIAVGAAALLLLAAPAIAQAASAGVTSIDQIFPSASDFIAAQEGFRASPYWDINRYSWGYGTQAPGSTGTISEAQALSDMQALVTQNYYDTAYQITRPLSRNQWAALMSFAYNEGEGNVYNIIDDINAGNDAVLEPHWKQYVYAGGSVLQSLVDRRNAEWELWQS